ncbi:glycosyltransferase [Pseudactinotalea terrae]|uniref:glycosyltransferase n=1 Tax=Pseudactinotalea terrae TaxID=1743262 RepID=UPI001390B049|nr:glycosyltransferase [Pseudactinotalea terrae]
MSGRADVAVLTSGHDAADARLHRETAALQRRGLAVEVLALGSSSDGPDGATVRTWNRGNPVQRAIHAASLPWRTRARIVITLDPDMAFVTVLHRLLGPGRGRRIVADVHEDYAALLRDRAWARGIAGLLGRAWARLGSWAAAHADLTVVADSHLLPEAPRRIVLSNNADLSFLPAPADPEPQPRAIYIGDIRSSRGLDAMIEAIRRAPGWTLDLVGRVGTAAGRELLDRVQADRDLGGRVRVHGQLPPRQAWQLAQGAWAGMLLLEDTPAFREAVPSKLYEYTAVGLAVVATPLPRVVDLLHTWGNGVVSGSAADVAEQLRAWSSRPADLASLHRAARNWRAGTPDEPTDLAAFATAVKALSGKASS